MAAASGGEDLMELEAMKKDDHSWHPCHVSLSSGDSSGLVLDFGNCDSEDIISTEAEALARLRVRSIPLQNGDCLHIKEEDHVLAMHKTQFRSMFFDAEVEKAWRVRHSNKVHCRCSFEIKWLHSELKGQTMKVPSTSILKLARDDICSHPTVGMFLNSVNPSKNSDTPSCVTPLEDTNYELDLESLLDNQIEEISKLADALDKAYSEEFLAGVKGVDLAGPKGSKAVSYLHNHSPYNQSNSRRSTRSQRKLQLETEHKFPPPLSQPVPEVNFEKSHLSPLAARAALASLVHELPQKSVIPQFPVLPDPIQIMDDDISLDTIHEKSPVSSRRGASKKNQLMEGSLEALSMQENPTAELKILEDGSLNGPATKGRKLNGGTIATRQTRSAVQKETGNSINEVKVVSPTKDDPSKKPTTPKRLTRSAVEKKRGNSNDEVKQEFSTKEGKSNSHTIKIGLTDTSVQKETGNSTDEDIIESSTKDGKLKINAITRRLTRSAIHKGMENPINEVKVGSSNRDRKSNSHTVATRLTRSAVQKEMEMSTNEVNVDSSTIDERSDNHNITRLTHSAVRKEMRNSINGVESVSSIEYRELNRSTTTTRLTRSTIREKTGNSTEGQQPESSTDDMKKGLTRSAIQKEREQLDDSIEVESVEDRNSNGPTNPTRSTRSAYQKEMVNSSAEVEIQSSTNDRELNSPAIAKRFTRSAIQREMGSSTTKSEEQQEKRKRSRDEGADVSVDVFMCMNKETKKKSHSAVESTENSSQQRQEMKKVSSTLINNIEGETSGDGEGFEVEKRKAISKKPQLQVANKNSFSPRTRAQKKGLLPC
ncbi:uncharacterized protein LOC131243660 [Magnolia sinica]|uniref:uncharacterized protein LOC131243660 n=1 Tax=Magnolia sinica TaxID=86752 RepID=UPI0026592D74|nr:uncharacterized protein LOC131243660 [Magnolia sinica]